MFIGRKQELNTLNKLYRSDRLEFTVIYGSVRLEKPPYLLNVNG